MKKILIMITVMFTFTTLLVACGNDDKDNSSKESATNNNQEQQEDTNTDKESGNDDDKVEDDKDEETDSSSGVFEINVEDQLDLGVGDTGTFDTTLGTYDVTLVSVKLEDEINGEKSDLDRFIILDFIVKNTSQETQNVEDIIYSLEVTENLDGTGFPDGAEYFDGFEKLSGKLEPGEEMEGKFITFVYEAEEYYFRKDPGNVAAGSSNQVMWTIKADEAQ